MVAIYSFSNQVGMISARSRFVRENGMVEIAEYPGPRVIAKSAQALSKGRHSILIEFDNNEVRVQVDNIQVVDSNHLSRQALNVLATLSREYRSVTTISDEESQPSRDILRNIRTSLRNIRALERLSLV